ncbi:uncharacterized protein BJ171DRAFT_151693 [Polychytrium aggregatum]|uniref:uncharacterized protein n=1 Tax=Polychytrium aggregatum TaxID=110093 RepID=UPI0022FDBC36|nr:uncharacterized protein BJ171DRAFT_151693 [Polychytrium aggregatum]KAI9188496.1 hypothetical protein BJ171DRAFT_151693 [Polychytrium aggregatum]
MAERGPRMKYAVANSVLTAMLLEPTYASAKTTIAFTTLVLNKLWHHMTSKSSTMNRPPMRPRRTHMATRAGSKADAGSFIDSGNALSFSLCFFSCLESHSRQRDGCIEDWTA